MSLSDPVLNVSADDLSLSVGTVVSVSGNGPYVFEVTGLSGPVTATLDGDITDATGIDLPAYQWQFAICTPDSDGDGVGDCGDACPNTIPGASVDLRGCPATVRADFDGDGDVDTADLDTFEACATGPGVPQVDPACAAVSFDNDDDVDQSDFGMFQRCISGEGIPVDPDCEH